MLSFGFLLQKALWLLPGARVSQQHRTGLLRLSLTPELCLVKQTKTTAPELPSASFCISPSCEARRAAWAKLKPGSAVPRLHPLPARLAECTPAAMFCLPSPKPARRRVCKKKVTPGDHAAQRFPSPFSTQQWRLFTIPE